MADSISVALRQKKQSSMRLALEAVKHKQADACVSAGNTGALMALGRMLLKTCDGIERPAIMSALPTANGACYMLDLGDKHVVELIQLADPAFDVDQAQVHDFLRKEDEPLFEACPDAALVRFLDGLIVHFRGRDDSQPVRAPETRVSNNLVLKKLRVAFQLKDVDMHAIFEAAGFPLSKPELSALFRQPDHKNYRACGDQLLRNFLKGLTARLRGNG